MTFQGIFLCFNPEKVGTGVTGIRRENPRNYENVVKARLRA
jgi:hypothetical protein